MADMLKIGKVELSVRLLHVCSKDVPLPSGRQSPCHHTAFSQRFCPVWS